MNRLLAALALATLWMSPHPAKAEPKPGDSCSLNNAVIHSGGPEESGNGYWLVCKAGTWTGIITTDANGMASTNTPTAAAHIATKGYVDAQGSGQLNVYKYDGVTLVGKFLGGNPYGYYVADLDNTGIPGAVANCVNLWYLNTATDAPAALGFYNCNAYNYASYTIYSNANCTGSIRNNGGFSYGCTGAAPCKTVNIQSTGGDLGAWGSTASYRHASSGICYSGNPNFTSTFETIPFNAICGDGYQQYCKVKP